MFTAGPAYGVAMGTFESAPLYHASLHHDEYRALVDENGFSVVAHVVEDETCGRHTIWLAQRIWATRFLDDHRDDRTAQKSRVLTHAICMPDA